jgi:tetrahydromethanopterin S-methyltransferase subunit F
MHDTPENDIRLRFNGLTLGVLLTVLWMTVAGYVVQHRNEVPSEAVFKGSQTNAATCAVRDVRILNQCLDEKYDRLLSNWRTEAGVAVVMPPMLAWIAALLHSLAYSCGLFRRRQGA